MSLAVCFLRMMVLEAAHGDDGKSYAWSSIYISAGGRVRGEKVMVAYYHDRQNLCERRNPGTEMSSGFFEGNPRA